MSEQRPLLMCLLCSVLFGWFFETRYHYVAQDTIKLSILLPQPPECLPVFFALSSSFFSTLEYIFSLPWSHPPLSQVTHTNSLLTSRIIFY